MKRSRRTFSRRKFLADSAAVGVASLAGDSIASALAAGIESAAPRQAMGTKVGEVTDSSAIVWTRLTAEPVRNNGGIVVTEKKGKKGKESDITVPIAQLEGACPGAAGRIRVRYGLKQDLSDAETTGWVSVSEKTDFSHQFPLEKLKSASVYHYGAETTGPDGASGHGVFRGKFSTAPSPTAPAEVRFCVMTCQGYPDRDHPDGHPIYPAMLAFDPHFVAYTGDNVYYDNDAPRAQTVELARYHWQRMFSLPRQIEMLRNVAGYFEKDDHDTCRDDCWPGMKLGSFTFADGQQIFLQQVPMGERTYRTFRWGRDLQIWLMEGRDFRSPNNSPDGPEKTIWGAEQKAWFKRTVLESDATWKVLINETPVVGPDRKNKKDNLSNAAWKTEGDELRSWMAAHVPDNFFVVTGDRHWQYHSVHPQTKVREFSCGPASNSHASGTPGEDPAYHLYHAVRGGFVAVTVRREVGKSVILCENRDVKGVVKHSWKGQRAVG